MSHVGVEKTLGARPLGHPNPSGFLKLIYPKKVQDLGAGGVDVRSEGGVPVEPASVVASVFGQRMRNPMRGRGGTSIH